MPPSFTEDEIKWLALRHEASEKRLSGAVEAFNRAGLTTILIKGWAIARNYAEPWKRPFSDLDFCVSPADFETAEALLRSDAAGYGIDLHKGLRHLDSAPWDDLVMKSRTIDLEGVQVRILRDEDHLRVLVTHWLNDGGVKRDRLWDIFYCINGCDSVFDWHSALDGCPEHRRGWIAKVLAVCRRYQGMEFGELPFSDEELNLPAWFTRALEREWNAEPLYPLYYLLGQPVRFLRQLRKRFPPNPIQSTIEADAAIEDVPRMRYALSSFFRRIPTGLRLAVRNISHKPWK